MTLDLQTLIASAIALHDAERDIDRWEIEIGHAERTVATAGPKGVERLCRDSAVLRIQMDAGFRMQCDGGQAIRDRDPEDADPERVGEIARQRVQGGENGSRLLDLRARLRRLDDALGDVVHRLEARDLPGILLHVLPHDGTTLDMDAITALVGAWHEAVADAKAAWRTMHHPRPVMMIVGSSGRAEVQAALRTMQADGRVVRHRFPTSTWSLAPASARAA